MSMTLALMTHELQSEFQKIHLITMNTTPTTTPIINHVHTSPFMYQSHKITITPPLNNNNPLKINMIKNDWFRLKK